MSVITVSNVIDSTISTADSLHNAHHATPGFAGGSHCIVAQPNQSASWETNKQLLIGFSLFSCVIATAFSLIGAWMILPFAGLEMTALGGALYIVCRKLNLRHVLRIDEAVLIIEKGIGQPQHSWRFSKSACSILVERKHHPWDPISIAICGYDEQGALQQIPVGEFLNQADSQLLLETLKQQGLSIRSDSRCGHIEL